MLGDSIREYRKRRGLTQNELGEMVGLTGVAIMHYEKGQRQPDDDTFVKIQAVLEIPIIEILSSILSEIDSEDLIQVLEMRGVNLNLKSIPKLCGILGVKVYEEFYCGYEREVYIVNNLGQLMFRYGDDTQFYYVTNVEVIYNMIEHPELIRKKV